MSENTAVRLSWAFVGAVFVVALVLFGSGIPVGASEDHERAHDYRRSGAAVPLAQLLARPELSGHKVLEAELEEEHGRLVYELEILDKEGRVIERYYDASTGEPIERMGER